LRWEIVLSFITDSFQLRMNMNLAGKN
jgi:hypothetical protein